MTRVKAGSLLGRQGREMLSGSRVDHVTGSGQFSGLADCEIWVWAGVLEVGWARSPPSSPQGRHSQSWAPLWWRRGPRLPLSVTSCEIKFIFYGKAREM